MMVGMFGSRYGGSKWIIHNVLNWLKQQYGNDLFIIVGDCIGVDEMVYRCCKELDIKVGVMKVWNNWSKISYECDSNDIIEVVGVGVKELRKRLAMRSMRLVEVVAKNNGMLIGYRVDGKGSKLVIKEGLKRGLSVYVVNNSGNIVEVASK